MSKRSPQFAKNFEAYQRFLQDEQWALRNKDKYVLFVDGMPIDWSFSEAALLDRFYNSRDPSQEGFYIKVGTEPEIEDVPTLDEYAEDIDEVMPLFEGAG